MRGPLQRHERLAGCHRRSDPCGQHLILVAITGQDKDRQLASDGGFDLHLSKPADVNALDAMLQKDAANGVRMV